MVHLSYHSFCVSKPILLSLLGTQCTFPSSWLSFFTEPRIGNFQSNISLDPSSTFFTHRVCVCEWNRFLQKFLSEIDCLWIMPKILQLSCEAVFGAVPHGEQARSRLLNRLHPPQGIVGMPVFQSPTISVFSFSHVYSHLDSWGGAYMACPLSYCIAFLFHIYCQNSLHVLDISPLLVTEFANLSLL